MWAALLVVAALCLRRPDLITTPQLWAEDGAVFYEQALIDPWAAITQRYSGYLHFFPRLVALIVSAAPVAWGPTLYMLAALIAALIVVAYLTSTRIDLPHRPLLALAIVLVPHNGEVFLNLTNAQWTLALVFPLLAIAREPETLVQRLTDTGALLLIGLTGPFVIFFLPLLAWRLWLRRSGFSLLLFAIACVLALVQLAAMEHARAAGTFHLQDRGWLRFAGEGIAGLFLFGRSASVFSADQLAGLSALLIGGLGWLAWRERDERRGVFLLAAISILAAIVYAFRGNPNPLLTERANRYYFLPMVLLAWTLITSLRWRTWPLVIVLVMSWAATLKDFRRAPLVDLDWANASRCIHGPVSCSVPINPPGWSVRSLK